MAILVTCGACGAKLRVRDEYAGKDVWCPSCKAPLTLTGERVPNHEVFISYSSKDKTVADAICATLEEKKIRCWVAPRDISAGNSWGGSIIEAIEDAQIMVLVYSGNSNLSPQVIREVERAVAKGLPIVPFRIEATPMSKEMEYFLSASHWFDALTPPLEKHLARLTETIKTLLLNRDRKKIDGEAVTPVASPARKIPWLLLSLALTSLLLAIGLAIWIQHYRRNTIAQTVPATNAVINLMPLIDLTNDVVSGTWRWKAGKLTSGNERDARVQLPYEPPQEYDFRIVFSRVQGNDAISQIFSQNGHAAQWSMGVDGNRDFRWNLIGSQAVTEKRVNQCLENGRVHTSTLRVRKNGVKAYLDENLIGNWITDFSDASLPVTSEIPNHRQIGIKTYNSITVFHQIDVVEISGTGRVVGNRSNLSASQSAFSLVEVSRTMPTNTISQ